MALLEVKNLGISFGGLQAVDDLTSRWRKGSSTVSSAPTAPVKPPSLTF